MHCFTTVRLDNVNTLFTKFVKGKIAAGERERKNMPIWHIFWILSNLILNNPSERICLWTLFNTFLFPGLPTSRRLNLLESLFHQESVCYTVRQRTVTTGENISTTLKNICTIAGVVDPAARLAHHVGGGDGVHERRPRGGDPQEARGGLDPAVQVRQAEGRGGVRVSGRWRHRPLEHFSTALLSSEVWWWWQGYLFITRSPDVAVTSDSS